MGVVKETILNYLQYTGRACPVNTIRAAVEREYRVTAAHMNTALYQLYRDGYLIRPERGVYALSRAHRNTIDRLIVAGTLDRLEAEYGDAFVDELRMRGWRLS